MNTPTEHCIELLLRGEEVSFGSSDLTQRLRYHQETGAFTVRTPEASMLVPAQLCEVIAALVDRITAPAVRL